MVALYDTSGDPVGQGMECLQVRQTPGPFHYLISEQAKSLVALQELQNEVGALLEFRDLVIETFPNLRSKMTSSTVPGVAMNSGHLNSSNSNLHSSNIPVSIRATDWTPGVKVRKKLGASGKDETRSGKKSDLVQDSGFSTETSSKETHSASSTALQNSSTQGNTETDEAEDELWNLLDVIHRKGTRLKDEVEALQGTLRHQQPFPEETNFERVIFRASADDVRKIRQERDLLLDRLAEMEAEVLASRVYTSRLQEDLDNLLVTKQDLEEQLKAIVSQRGEVNSRIHDLHSQFVGKNGQDGNGGGVRLKPGSSAAAAGASEDDRKDFAGDSSQKTGARTAFERVNNNISDGGKTNGKSVLDVVLGDRIPMTAKTPDREKISAILCERDLLVLQKHLLSSTVKNQVLQEQIENSSRVEVCLVDKLDKAREENEELRFQLEDKNIELEGTRARVRMLEQFQKPSLQNHHQRTSPDIIPTTIALSSIHPSSRSEITTSSMKHMSPLPMNLQSDHTSSTESAHDQAESNRRSSESATRRKPSKIPLKSYTAPKPPGGKHSPASTTRSRSGESPGRSHSAQSYRNRSEGNSLSTLSKSNSSLPKSRNGSLITSKDSLSSKLRSSDSLSKLSPSMGSFGSHRGTLRKNNAPVKWTANPSGGGGGMNNRDSDKANTSLESEKFQYQWNLSSYKGHDIPELENSYLDSLDKSASIRDKTESIQDKSASIQATDTSTSHRFQTANTFVWNVTGQNGAKNEYYDSIDSNFVSSFYQLNGEDMADCDSLEKRVSDISDK